MEERINTARFKEVTQIDSLTAGQKMAVVALRKFAKAQGVSPYTLGVLCQRDFLKLAMLRDGGRYARLSPASREILISELRDETHPHEPSAVAIFSHWAEINNVDCEEYDREPTPVLRLVEDVLVGADEAVLSTMAKRYGTTPMCAARWCTMAAPNNKGHAYGSKMPDRESDEGLEVANMIFEACMPRSPVTVAHRMRRAK